MSRAFEFSDSIPRVLSPRIRACPLLAEPSTAHYSGSVDEMREAAVMRYEPKSSLSAGFRIFSSPYVRLEPHEQPPWIVIWVTGEQLVVARGSVFPASGRIVTGSPGRAETLGASRGTRLECSVHRLSCVQGRSFRRGRETWTALLLDHAYRLRT